jgi:hypothetical protein
VLGLLGVMLIGRFVNWECYEGVTGVSSLLPGVLVPGILGRCVVDSGLY